MLDILSRIDNDIRGGESVALAPEGLPVVQRLGGLAHGGLRARAARLPHARDVGHLQPAARRARAGARRTRAGTRVAHRPTCNTSILFFESRFQISNCNANAFAELHKGV